MVSKFKVGDMVMCRLWLADTMCRVVCEVVGVSGRPRVRPVVKTGNFDAYLALSTELEMLWPAPYVDDK